MAKRLKSPKTSPLESLFELYLKANKVTGYQREYRFHPKRKWRFDFAFVRQKLAVELEGGVWAKSRHTTGDGFHKDCDKYNAAVELGWSVLRFTGRHVSTGQAMDTTLRCLQTME